MGAERRINCGAYGKLVTYGRALTCMLKIVS
jgi:hypothetical protein